MNSTKKKKIIEISQDDHYCLHLRYAEKNGKQIRKIPRYGTNKNYDDIRILNIIDDIINRKDEIKSITDTFSNKRRYTQIAIDDQIIVLENPYLLFQRADFANLSSVIKSRKKEINLQQAKLKRAIIRGIAVGVTASIITGGALATISTLSVDASTSDEITSIQSAETGESIEEKMVLDSQNSDTLNQTYSQEEDVVPNPVVIPDEISIEDINNDIYIQERSLDPMSNDESPEDVSENTYLNSDMEFLGLTYGMTQIQIEQICEIYGLDVASSSFSTIQEAISDTYWQNPKLYSPTFVSSDQNSVETEICKAAKAYGFTSDEEMATLLAISRLETGYYSSEKFKNLNNLAGVRDSMGNFIYYNNISQGAIGLAKTVANIKNRMIKNGTYNENITLASNIGPTFCPANESEAPWGPTVDNLKVKILNSGELQDIQLLVNNSDENKQGVAK